MGSKPCSICSHKARASIDLALANGTSERQTAHQFGLSASAVHRHKTVCMKRTPMAVTAPIAVPVYQTPAEAAIERQNVRSVAARAEQLVAKMEGLVEAFEKNGNAGGIIKASKEVREGLRLLAQLSGELGPGVAVGVQVNNTAPSLMLSPEWPVVTRVIDRHPEIKSELITALREAGL